MCVTLLLLLLSALGDRLLAELDLQDPAWIHFKSKYGKTYSSLEEEARRLAIFRRNSRLIAEHNAGDSSFRMGVNHLADLSSTEYRALLNKRVLPAPRADEPGDASAGRRGPTGISKDWRAEGAVTFVRDTGSCDASWAFAATGAVESAWYLAGHTLVSLSEQQLLDCSHQYGNNGCDGGLAKQAFEYVTSAGGLEAETDYPYRNQTDYRCRLNDTATSANISNWMLTTRGSEAELEYVVFHIGPVACAMDASHKSFQLYSHGVYSDLKCSTTRLTLSLLIVGYGVENGVPFWLMKNAWGYGWGEQGYIKLQKGHGNMCGIASDCSYPVV
ncbi:procathepsin L-like [Pollicipes pollicipes]|uniref:procathepsin L-like n=1 Tax=Pollicipes pollicipes TaxID=41117 RepID=UPI00188503D8|nr:procathepsin L-like [Pollicipes pollicipes]